MSDLSHAFLDKVAALNPEYLTFGDILLTTLTNAVSKTRELLEDDDEVVKVYHNMVEDEEE